MYLIEYYWQNPLPKEKNSGWYPIVKYEGREEAEAHFQEIKNEPMLYRYRLRDSGTDEVCATFDHPDLDEVIEEKPKKKRTRRKKKS